MKVVGYSDKLSVQQGESIKFMVSCELPSYRASIARLVHCDDNPSGPGFKEELVGASADGTYQGRRQHLRSGSYVIIGDNPLLRDIESFTLQAWISPTTPRKGLQGIMTKWSASDGAGFGLFVSREGQLLLRVGQGMGRVGVLLTGQELLPSNWYFVAGAYESGSGRLSLHQEHLAPCRSGNRLVSVEGGTDVRLAPNGAPLLIGGYSESMDSRKTVVEGSFNGKIEAPRLYQRALTSEELEGLKRESVASVRRDLVAAWDFSIGISTSRVADVFNDLDGIAVNMPTRGVTGHNWTGKVVKFSDALDEYGAMYFHDDDLDDAGWETGFEYEVPLTLESGVYAAHLRAGDEEDYVPFFVRPRRGTAKNKIAFLVPTLSYLAYANEHTMTLPDVANAVRNGVRENYPSSPEDKYVVEHRLLSLYDRHSDGSGVCYSSRLRPLMNMRPKYNSPFLPGPRGGPHQFNADMHIVDWLAARGHQFDVITDEDLHHEGAELLSSYRVVITGSHPEYWTESMMQALEEYLRSRGRLMYLGGNGFYWVTSIGGERSHVVEIRRWGGSGTWRAAPGECYHSTTGEIGGIWRNRGRAPNKLVGVGWAAQGLDTCRPYGREPDSFDPRVAFIFEGIGAKEIIGDFESLDMVHGAAGFEIDRLDRTLGSPYHTLLLASGTGYSDAYQRTIDEVLLADSKQGGTMDPLVRSDMVYLEYQGGGAVFSVGSIGWCGCLSYNNYDNNVSRVTENVLRKFVS